MKCNKEGGGYLRIDGEYALGVGGQERDLFRELPTKGPPQAVNRGIMEQYSL